MKLSLRLPDSKDAKIAKIYNIWTFWLVIIIAKRGDNRIGSVRLSVCMFVCLSILGAWLCRVQQRAKRSHYQSKVIFCASVINQRVWLIAQMRSIGFYYWLLIQLIIQARTSRSCSFFAIAIR